MLDSLLCSMALLAPAPAQQLFVVESTNRRVLLFDEATGTLVDPAYLDAGGLAPATTPIETLRAPSGELLVSDQVSDTVLRFSADRTAYLGSSTVPLNNVHGLAVAYGSIWVTNSGPNPVGPTNALVQLDQSLNLVATYALPGTPFDVLPFRWQGVDGFLLTDFDNHDILFFDPANPGALATFHASSGVGGVHFPMYLARSEATGNVFCGGLIAPAGIYEYSGATGAQVRYIQNPGGQTQVRAAHPLFDGRILFTNDQGIHRYDPASGTSTTLVANVNAHAISRFLDGRFGASYCTAVRNSTGVPAFLHAVGSPLRSLNEVELQCVSLPRNAAAFFLASRTQGFVAQPAGSAGNLCLGGAIGRYVGPGQVRNSGLAGAVALRLDLGRVPTPTGSVSVIAGETWSFQCWFRDSAGGAPTSNFSNGRALPFQ